MEVRGQEKEMGSSSSRKDLFFVDQTQTQTLDHHPLYCELNLRHKPRRDPPDPVSDPLGATTSLSAAAGGSDLLETTPKTTSAAAAAVPSIRYRECQKNHAAAMGGHVFDGCGEFMPCGDDGTPEALKCAACECHRNFHRKEVDGKTQYAAGRQNYTRRDAITITPSLPRPPNPGGQAQTALQHQHHHDHRRLISPIAPMMMAFGGSGAAAESSSEDLNMYQQQQPNNYNNNLQGRSRKRFRTKFSREQKEKMMEFAEKIEWKIQKQNEEQVQQFCGQLGVKRQVFKVWMHNNKKKQ